MIEGCGLPGGSVVACIAGLRESTGNVVGIRGSLEILEVARHAGVGGQVEVVVDVAVRASPRRDGMHTGEREVDAVVVEGGRRPACRGMAGAAGLRESARNMVGIRGSLEILQVARHAGRGIQRVVVVDVAIGAGARRHRVHSRQRKPGTVVIECRVCPVVGAVALLARLRKTRGDVIGIGCTLEIR